MIWLMLLLFVLGIVYIKVQQPLQYWKKKKVPHVQPWPVIGNLGDVIFRRKAFCIHVQEFCNKYPDRRYFGFYELSRPTLVIRDPNLVKQICVKDFEFFADHAEFLPRTSDPFWNKNLFSMTGKEWHDMRSVLSPAFTASKMKMMFALMQECAEELINWLEKKVPTSMEIRDTLSRFTSNVIGSTAFGIKVDALKNQDDEFYRLGREAFNFEGLKALKFFGYGMSPTLMKLFNVSMFSDHTRHFFLQIVKSTIRQREETGLVRMDMIHLLREAQKGRLKNEEGDEIDAPSASAKTASKALISDEDFAAQAMVFFFGGFDTVGGLLSALAYELAVNPDAQEKLAEEIAKTLEECKGEVTYQKLLDMKYLDMVVSETLRLWPPPTLLNRKVVKPYTIQPDVPGEEALCLEEGCQIWIPVYAIHRDPKYHPNPDNFDPERFSEENKHKIVPCSYVPFGAGPRMCIASRFALLEAKTLVFYLLSKFELAPVEKTDIPFIVSKKHLTLNSTNGYWVGLKNRK